MSPFIMMMSKSESINEEPKKMKGKRSVDNDYSSQKDFKSSDEIIESSWIKSDKGKNRKNKRVEVQEPNEQSQFYIKRNENMFINNQIDSQSKQIERGRLKRIQKDFKELDDKLSTQKLFMNMVIHDLRNPAEAIKQGLMQAKSLYQKEQNFIITETNEVITKNILKPNNK